MAPKYKNDLAKCFAVLQLKHEWKTACDNDSAFAKAITDITAQLSAIQKPHMKVCPVSASNDQESFSKSLEQFFIEYGCPYSALIGPANERFSTAEKRMSALSYLCTELLAHRRLSHRAESTQSQASQASSHASSEMNAELTNYLCSACAALGLPRPTEGFDLPITFDTIGKAATEAIKRCPPSYYGHPMIPLTGLSDRQWSQVTRIAALLQQDYASRQATLLKRLDVTVQSFKWSEKAKSQLEAIAAVYRPLRVAMAKSNYPGIPELLAVRDNMLLRIEKTSSSRARLYTSCALNKILIGQVPDRGGRAWELEPPPPEMPSFKQRQPDRERGGRGGGRGGAGRGYGDHGFQDRGPIQHHSFRPPAPSAAMGGADYVVTPSTYAALNQQMSGLVFDPGFGVVPPQACVFQPTGFENANGFHPGSRRRPGRGRGRSRPY